MIVGLNAVAEPVGCENLYGCPDQVEPTGVSPDGGAILEPGGPGTLPPAETWTWIPGVSNTTVLLAGAGALVGGIFLFGRGGRR